MATQDPLQIAKRLLESYRTYLLSGFPLASRYTGLQRALQAEMDTPGKIHRGPYLEISPPFRHDERTVGDMIGSSLNPKFGALLERGPNGEDPLLPKRFYRHQSAAINRLCSGDIRSIVVATGTGSGKTECFQVPILNDLLSDPTPGIRAILIYPMNALVEDQLARWERMLKRLGLASNLLGRYTGLTPEPERKAMRVQPPAILITNFSMLEHLLERPKDSPLWDHANKLRWLVLDEAHSYTGAVGIDIAMLIRRFKLRLGIERGRIHGIATSASLSREHVAEVASAMGDLLGETVREEDVLFGEQEDPAEWIGVPDAAADVYEDHAPGCYSRLAQLVEEDKRLEELVTAAREAFNPQRLEQAAKEARAGHQDPAGVFLYHLLKSNPHLRRTAEALIRRQGERLVKNPLELEELTRQVLGEKIPANATNEMRSAAREGVSSLIRLGLRARPALAEECLLPARYHLFMRGGDGLHLCLDQHNEQDPPSQLVVGDEATKASSEWSMRIHTGGAEKCPICESMLIEIATCYRCGGLYYLAHAVDADKLAIDGPKTVFLLPKEEETLLLDSPPVRQYRRHHHDAPPWVKARFDLKTGEKVETGGMSFLQIAPDADFVNPDEHAEVDLKRCLYCGFSPRQWPVCRRLLTGNEAALANIVDQLYRQLPTPPHNGRDCASDVVGEGRKLIIFNDNRQDAAYFAPYLQRTQQDFMNRYWWAQVLMESGAMKLGDLAAKAFDAMEGDCAHQHPDLDNKFKRHRQDLLNELSTSLTIKNSLEGAGIATLRPNPKMIDALPEIRGLAQHGLSTEDQKSIYAFLLQQLRTRGALGLGAELIAQNDFGQTNTTHSIVSLEREQDIPGYSIIPWRGQTARLTMAEERLSELLQRRGNQITTEALRAIITEIWENLTKSIQVFGHHPSSFLRQIQFGANANGNPPPSYVLDANYFLVEPLSVGYRCNLDGIWSGVNMGGVCPRKDCKGSLEPAQPVDVMLDDHYYQQYTMGLEPILMEVREHTAQLDINYGRKIQQDFCDGRVNVLSCSTTFEMGIDLGDLQSVVMANVPPRPNNYMQRAGRAGRRVGSLALIVVFCRQRVFDRAHFAAPQRLIAARLNPPIVNLRYEIPIERHFNAYVWSSFLLAMNRRLSGAAADWVNLEQVFEAAQPGLLPADEFPKWIHQNRTLLEKGYVALRNQTKLNNLPWDEFAAQLVTRWGNVCRSYQSEIETWKKYIQDLRERRNQSNAKEIEALGRLESQYERQLTRFRQLHWIQYLDSLGFLPNYAFPIDVIKLHIMTDDFSSAGQAMMRDSEKLKLERDRQIAISEYSPGARIVADGKLWTSDGLWRGGFVEAERKYYRTCKCGHIQIEKTEAEFGPSCPCCQDALTRRPALYEVPTGFFSATPPKEVSARRPRPPRPTRAFLHAGQQTENQLQTTGEQSDVQFLVAGQTPIFVANQGATGTGFLICRSCGRLLRTPDQPHRAPSGRSCPANGAERLHLGHTYETEILRLHFKMPWAGAHGVNGVRGSLWLSMMAALEDAAIDILQIEPDAVGALTAPPLRYESGIQDIVLFDRAKGGVGLVRQLESRLIELLDTARDRLMTCNCQSACLNCLITYGRQWCADQLNRHLVIQYLDALMPRLRSEGEQRLAGEYHLTAARPVTWLQQLILWDGLRHIRRKQVLFAIDDLYVDESPGDAQRWESVLLDVAPQLSLAFPEKILNLDSFGRRQAIRYLLGRLKSLGAKLYPLRNERPEWACIVDAGDMLTGKAVRFSGPIVLGAPEGQEPLQPVSSTVHGSSTNALAQNWKNSCQPKEVELKDVTLGKDRFIPIMGGRRGKLADYYGEFFTDRPLSMLAITNTYLAGQHALERVSELLDLIIAAPAGCDVQITTNPPDPRRTINPICKTEQELGARIRQLILSKPGLRPASRSVCFKSEKDIHDRMMRLKYADGYALEIYCGRGLDFINHDGMVQNTYLVVRENID